MFDSSATQKVRSGCRTAADNFLPKNIKSASAKSLLALADQGLISGSNFILSIVLARTLSPDDYGVYAVGFEVFLLLSIVYNSLVLEPMSVFGASVFREHTRRYFGTLVRVHALGSAVIVMALAASAWAAYLILPSGSLAGALAGVGVAGPVILLYWIARRAFYMKLSPRVALTGGGVYFTVMMWGVFLLHRWQMLYPLSAFLLMAVSAGAASVPMLWALKPRRHERNDGPASAEVLRRHWAYGRWALASAVPGWFFSGAMYYPLLGFFGGLGEAGKLKALFNLNSPVTQAFVAISMLSLPYASHVYHRDGSPSVNRLIWRLTVVYAAGTSAYWALLLAFRGPAVHALYGGKYDLIASLLPWVALGSVFRITASAEANVLRAMESPVQVCKVYSAVGLIAVAVGVPAIWLYGIRGAIFTFAVSGIAAFVFGVITVNRASSKVRLGAEAVSESAISAGQASMVSQG